MAYLFQQLRRLSSPEALAKLFLGAVLTWALLLRLVSLGNIPGVIGDEAWYGVKMQELYAKGAFVSRTPSGNLLNPFHSGLLFLLQLIFPPSFWILRMPAALAGILLVALSYVLLRRVVSTQTAFVSALVLAVLPINIAFSRLGSDASQSALVGLIAVYFALAGNALGTAATFSCALLIHPSNIFVAPALMGPYVARGVRSWRQQGIGAVLHRLVCIKTGFAIILVLTAALLFLPKGYTPPLTAVKQRSLDLWQWAEFLWISSDFFSGLKIYRFIAGEPGAVMSKVHAYGFPLFVLAAIVLGTPRLIKKRDPNEIGLILGSMAAGLAFFLAANSRALRTERYFMFLVVPTVLSLSFFLASAADTSRGTARLRLFLTAIGFLFLLSFSWNYFHVMIGTGGRSEPIFRTAGVEPKAAALALIRNHVSPTIPLSIVADEGSTYWPIRYLAAIDPRIRVVRLGHPSEIPEALNRGAYIVGFPDGPSDRFLRRKSYTPEVHSWVVPSYAGDPAVLIWRRVNSAGIRFEAPPRHVHP